MKTTRGGIRNKTQVVYLWFFASALLLVVLFFYKRHQDLRIEQSEILFSAFSSDVKNTTRIVISDENCDSAGLEIELDHNGIQKFKEHLLSLVPDSSERAFKKVNSSGFCGQATFFSYGVRSELQLEFYARNRSGKNDLVMIDEFDGEFVIRNDTQALVLMSKP
jgi:hypothetical protein